VHIKASEAEKYFALLAIHSFLHKSKAMKLILDGEIFKI